MTLAPKVVGRRIKDARKRKGWTALRLAQEMGVTEGSIYKWQRGELPRLSTLLRLADVLGIPSEQLIQLAPTGEGQLAEALEEIETLRGEIVEERTAREELDRRLRELDALVRALGELPAEGSPGAEAPPQSRPGRPGEEDPAEEA